MMKIGSVRPTWLEKEGGRTNNLFTLVRRFLSTRIRLDIKKSFANEKVSSITYMSVSLFLAN